jgi:hypothetical protein
MVTRAQLLKELEPGLNAIFGEEYNGYENEHLPLFDVESSNRAFEEEVLFPGFGAAAEKAEGQGVTYADTGESWIARYSHKTIALAFAITEEAIEDNLYDSLSKRLTKFLARSMAHTKQVDAANIYNRAFNSSYAGGDGVELCDTGHPLVNGGTLSNRLNPDADLSETSLESAIIAISKWTDDKGIPQSIGVKSLHIPTDSSFVAERILKSPLRVETADNDINAMYSMSSVPGGWMVNHRFTDTDAWFLRTDCPNGMKHFERKSVSSKMEGDFETGNVRYKSRERYSFGWSDWRGVYGSQGA